MLIDKLFDRFARRFRRSRREAPIEPHLNPNGKRGDPRNSHRGQHGSGFFNNAHHFTIDRSTFIENFVAGTDVGHHPVLELVVPYANLDAAVDSSARFPPPLCHPGTRLKIGDKLLTWFANPEREYDMIWLNGPAGTGKSAVAQTFAERCAEIGRLGASFFFSRPNNRNDPDTVIPSLVYHLAVCNPTYKSLVAAQLTNDPELLRKKTRRTQFKKLIVEPFLTLQLRGDQSVQEPLLVVLDGLDECKGENAQREIVEMISEVVRLKKNFPLIWLICSRPELHLKCLFSGPDFTVTCGREELAIDAESIADVDFYLRDGLAGIKFDFPYVTTPTWPPEEQIVELSAKASGHFGFASTSLRYIGDPSFSSPMGRLDNLLSFLGGVKVGTSNPLEALDALYTAIVEDVPNVIFLTTKQILDFFLFMDVGDIQTVHIHCNFLLIDQTIFYNAFRKLHSVIDIPPPEFASERHLRFYHASFEDYLSDPSRSGKFAVKKEDAELNYAKLCLSWYKTDLELFHTTDGPIFNKSHDHGVLPGLSWVSDDNRREISRKMAEEGEYYSWYALRKLDEWDEALRGQIQSFDFRYIRTDSLDDDWRSFVNKLWEGDSSSGTIRLDPRTDVDLRLLEYMKSMVGTLWQSRPATFPLEENSDRGEYFFLGYACKAVICWTHSHERVWCSMLNSDKPPSKERIDAYRAIFEKSDDDDQSN